ncbi:hypothetical protein [Limnobacter sp.]|uniref:hypothetical protein n=1 Tax=Limnobacter sp. TaxID=2003368 RepID=UPI002FE33013
MINPNIGTSTYNPIPAEAEIVISPGRSSSTHPDATGGNRTLDAAPGFQSIDEAETSAAGEARQVNNQVPAEVIEPLQPANSVVTGVFASRHRKLTKVIASVAACAAFAAAIIPLSVRYLLTSPVRMFITALNIISPENSVQLLKSKAVNALLGPFSLSIQKDVHRLRAHHPIRFYSVNAGLLIVDVATAGVFSIDDGLAASIDLAEKTYKKTRRALGLSEVLLETEANLNRAANAKPLVETINEWFSVLGESETPKTGFNEAVWKEYEKTFIPPRNSASFLSLLLTQMKEGFSLDFPEPGNIEVNPAKHQNKEKFKYFVNKRLLPMLIDMQCNQKVADQGFKLAEIGLGTCADRAVFGWMITEQGTQTAALSEQLIQIQNSAKVNNKEKRYKLLSLVNVEMQKFRLNEVRRFSDKILQDNKRDPSKGGWQSASSFYVPYAQLDHVEASLKLCSEVQKAGGKWFSRIPYIKFGAGFTHNEIKTARDIILAEMEKIENDPENTAALEHFMTSNDWQKILELEYPDTKDIKKNALEYCSNALTGLDDIEELLNDGESTGVDLLDDLDGRDAVLDNGKPKEYTYAAVAIDDLRKKFDGQKVTGKGHELPFVDFIDKKLKACEPAKIKANELLVNTAPFVGDLKNIENIANEISSESDVFSKVLEKKYNAYQLEDHEPANVTFQELGAVHEVLEELKNDIKNWKTNSENKTDELLLFLNEKLDGNIFNVIINVKDKLTQIRSATNFIDSLQSIESLRYSDRSELEKSRKIFTLNQIKGFKKIEERMRSGL